MMEECFLCGHSKNRHKLDIAQKSGNSKLFYHRVECKANIRIGGEVESENNYICKCSGGFDTNWYEINRHFKVVSGEKY